MAGALSNWRDRLSGFYRARWGYLGLTILALAAFACLHAALVIPGLRPLRETYGWDEVAEKSRALRATLPAESFYMAVGWRPYVSASELAFHLDQPDQVYGQNLIGRQALQYAFWANPQQLIGKDAVVVVEDGDPNGDVGEILQHYFKVVDPPSQLMVSIGKISFLPRATSRFTLYRARAYQASLTGTEALMVSTGQAALRTTSSATLPISNRLTPVRP
jgi:hypothetical protein